MILNSFSTYPTFYAETKLFLVGDISTMADGSVVQVLQDGYKELIASKSKKWISGDNELKSSSVETKVKGYTLGLMRCYNNHISGPLMWIITIYHASQQNRVYALLKCYRTLNIDVELIVIEYITFRQKHAV